VNRLLIVDGHAYAYRAFHAIRELRAPDGRPTNAIYGFVKMLEKMRTAVEPTHVMVVWDGGLSAERLAALPEYKAQRPEMPADLRPQLDAIGNFLMAAGVPQYRGDGVEADDYIASLARRAAAADWDVVIASSDKDFMQLVSIRIGLLNPNDKTGAVWTAEQVQTKTGVPPEQVDGWLALMGDAVDNIAGVPGVGPKTAAELLKQFGSVENLLTHVDEVKSERLRSALKDSTGVLRRNLQLVRLPEVPCDFAPERLAVKPADRVMLRGLFGSWGFKGMLAALEAEMISEKQAELI
jgi:DNA polymerase-1